MDTNSEWFDLTPDRNLLDFNFDGYKLSLDSLAQYKLEFKTFSIDSCNLNDIKDRIFFYQHQKLFNLYNHLFINEFLTNNQKTLDFYCFDKHLNLIKVLFNHEFNTRDLKNTGLSLDRSLIDFSKRYVSVSIKFYRKNEAVICDGYETLYFCSVMRNNDEERWTINAKYNLSIDNCENSLIKDVVLNENGLNLLLMNVIDKNGKHETIINWLTFHNFELKRVKKLSAFSTVPEYVCFERGPQNDSLIIIGSSLIRPIVTQDSSENGTSMESENSCESIKKFIKWNQTGEELNVKIDLPEKSLQKSDITRVDIKENSIEVVIRQNTLIKAQLHSQLNPGESFWQINSSEGVLELNLAKKNFLTVWSRLFADDSTENQCIYELNEVSSDVPMEITTNNASKKIFDLNQQLEECDEALNNDKIMTEDTQIIKSDEAEDFQMLVRYDSNRYTHKSYINNNKFLFQMTLDPYKTSAFCLRHDVDGLVWQPNNITQENSKLLTHEHTFLAFGYVQASKTNAKYQSAAPNCSYACICDANRHVYVYKHNSHKVESSLRNRKSGKVVTHVSKQYVISLDSDEDIIGIYCSNEYIVLLFVDSMSFIHVNIN